MSKEERNEIANVALIRAFFGLFEIFYYLIAYGVISFLGGWIEILGKIGFFIFLILFLAELLKVFILMGTNFIALFKKRSLAELKIWGATILDLVVALVVGVFALLLFGKFFG